VDNASNRRSFLIVDPAIAAAVGSLELAANESTACQEIQMAKQTKKLTMLDRQGPEVPIK
jgi:hypothetical protein